MNPNVQIFLGCVCVFLGIFGPLIVKDGWEKRARQAAMSQLDASSLAVIERTKGLIFGGVGIDAATLRYLMSASFIKIEIFPSEPITYGYYLTKEGRASVVNRLNRKIYPEIFCDLIRIRYWKGYPSDFAKRKEEFRKKYNISWDESWVALENLFKQEPKAQKDTIEIFNSFALTNNFETVMSKIVKPWLNETKKDR